MTVVLADGTTASSGGKVVKNVAGYDLAKLYCGSRGTLGLVVRAAFRLHPTPEAASTVVTAVSDAGVAAQLSRAALRSELAPSALDLLWPGGLALLVEGSERAVIAQVERARADLGAEPATRACSAKLATGKAAPAGVRTSRPRSSMTSCATRPRPSCASAPASRTCRPGCRGRHRLLSMRCVSGSRAEFDPARGAGCMNAAEKRRLANDCVHCGFCLPTCPTYVLWNEEMDSPSRPHRSDQRAPRRRP